MAGRFRCLFLALTFLGCSPKNERNAISSPLVVAQLPAGNAEQGRQLFATCQTCHGAAAEGNQKMRAPALVNMDGWYLYRQLLNYKKDVRGYLPEDTLGLQMRADL